MGPRGIFVGSNPTFPTKLWKAVCTAGNAECKLVSYTGIPYSEVGSSPTLPPN